MYLLCKLYVILLRGMDPDTSERETYQLREKVPCPSMERMYF